MYRTKVGSFVRRRLSDEANVIRKHLQRIDISGVWPPIPTPFEVQSPADKSNRRIPAGVNYDAIRSNIEKLYKIDFPGIVLQGSNGAYPYLDTSERVELVEISREIVDDVHSQNSWPGKQCPMIMAGAGAESTLESQKMCETMALAGADCFLIVAPSFYPLSPSAMEKHFKEVADFSPKPIIIHNVPDHTGLDLAPELIAELAVHPNICGIKESSGDIARLGQVLHLTRNQHFQVLAGSASFLFGAVALGASGGICALANVLGSECVSLYNLTRSGQFGAASQLQKRLICPNFKVTKEYGIPGLKVAMEYYGLSTGDLRAPLAELSCEEAESVRAAFLKNGFIGASKPKLGLPKMLTEPIMINDSLFDFQTGRAMGSLLPTSVASVEEKTIAQKVGSALFYAVCSNTLVFVNKSVLTAEAFPSRTLLGCGQMASAIFILSLLRWFRIVSFPRLSKDIVTMVFPLPLFYLANMLTGLGSTALLSLPMFTVLRRFSILFTMILEFIILQVRANRLVIWSVVIMIAGALVAAGNDLAFDLKAYTFILLNDLFTALYGVYTKKRLGSDLGKYGLLYYNSLFSLPIALTIAHYNDEITAAANFPGWSSSYFCFKIFLSCVIGFVLMYSLLLCTHYNSSLTTTVTGCMKNIFVTYVGMILPGSDYVFSAVNFIGINISVAGSLIYSYVVFKTKTPKS